MNNPDPFWYAIGLLVYLAIVLVISLAIGRAAGKPMPKPPTRRPLDPETIYCSDQLPEYGYAIHDTNEGAS